MNSDQRVGEGAGRGGTLFSKFTPRAAQEVHYSASLHHGPPKSRVLGDAEEQCRSSTSELPL